MFPVLKCTCAVQRMSTASRKRGIPQKEFLADKIHKSVKSVQAKELETLLFDECQYDKDSFKQEHVGRMRNFTEKLMQELEVESFAELQQMDEVIRSASLDLTAYAPPHGAAIWLAVCSVFCAVCACFCLLCVLR